MFKPQAFGKYILIDKISQGAMGEIYKAKSFGSRGFEKLFAIKRILPKLSQDKTFIDILADEAKIIVALSHSNIVPVYEYNRIGGIYYLAMEFIHGKDLQTIMGTVDSIPYEVACFVVAELSKGLHYLHTVRDSSGKKLSIVHQDINPRNVIVSFDGEVKIIDCGIANARSRAFTFGNDIFEGKYAYLSPEQLVGRELNLQSDIFSAGIVLYELLFKKLPSGRIPNRDMIAFINDESLDNPLLDNALMNTLPKELQGIIEKATNANLEHRYPSALMLYSDLMSFIFNYHKNVNSFTVAQYIKTVFSGDRFRGNEKLAEAPTMILSTGVSSFIERKKVAVLYINMNPPISDSGRNEKVISMFQEVLRLVQKQGGIIYRLQDTVLITVFGLPKNKEDDVYRALRATLEVRDYVSSLTPDIKGALTMAVDFGTVIVNFKDEDLNNFTLSEGPEKEVKELIALASPGDILCGYSIHELGKDQFEFVSREYTQGTCWALIDQTQKRYQQKSCVQEEHFINRQKELTIIEKALAELTEEKGKTITIRGEAGMGKTALIREIVRRAERSNIPLFVGSFHPYHKTPYSIFKQLIIHLFTDEGSQKEISASLIGDLQGFGLTPMELESIKSILSVRFKSETLAVLPLEKRKLIMNIALRKILKRIALQKTILIFEDLHWADELSLEALDSILALGLLPNILLIRTQRKEFFYPWKHTHSEEFILHLEPLNKNAMKNYLETITLLPLEEKTLTKIYDTTLGNPLFAGEFTRSLLDKKTLEKRNNTCMLGKDAHKLIIPDTIYALLAARFDVLPKQSKEILRLVSVIGNEWGIDIIGTLLNKDTQEVKRILRELQTTGMIQEGSSQCYTFSHVLMRDVIYLNIPADTKKLLHKKIADYILEKYKTELEEHTNELAYHYANSSDAERALHYLIRAGDEAREIYLLHDADQYYRQAIACFTNNQDLFVDSFLLFIELHYKGGMINQIIGKLDEAYTYFSQALSLSRDNQIVEFVPKIYHQISRIYSIKGEYYEALDCVKDAIRISQKLANAYDTLEFFNEEANIYRAIHNYTKALEVLRKGLPQAQKLEDKGLESKYLNNLGIVYENLHDYSNALIYYKKAFEIRKDTHDKLALSIVFTNISTVCFKIKKFDKAIKYAKRSLRISSEIEDKLGLCLNFNNLGEMYLAHNDLTQALTFFREGLAHSREMSWKEGIVSNSIHISLICLLMNQNIPSAKDLLEEALHESQELNNPELVAKCYLVKSKMLARENKAEESKLTFNNAEKLMRQNNLLKVLEDFERKLLGS